MDPYKELAALLGKDRVDSILTKMLVNEEQLRAGVVATFRIDMDPINIEMGLDYFFSDATGPLTGANDVAAYLNDVRMSPDEVMEYIDSGYDLSIHPTIIVDEDIVSYDRDRGTWTTTEA